MKKILLITLALFICAAYSYAQPHVEYSQAFEEPGDGWNKILQLKNSNTFYFHFTKKNGIDVTVFDKSRNVISNKTLTSELWDPTAMKSSSVEGLYEISGQPVLFLHQSPDHTPTLYRIVLDPMTGDIVKENRIGHIEKEKAKVVFSGLGIGVRYGGRESSDFHVEKDPYSDCYAVAYFNGMAEDASDKIKVLHYDGQHKKISAAYYGSPNDAFKYLHYIGMTVEGDKYVHVCTYGFNSKKENGKDSRIIVSKLSKGDSVFTHKILDFSEDFRDTRAVMKYNQGTGMIQLLTLTYEKSKHGSSYYLPLISYIDPETLFITATQPITVEKASAYIQSHLGKDGFNGLPQDMIINKDNTSTVLMEENQQEITRDRYGNIVATRTLLGNIGLTVLDNSGKEKDGYAIPKSQLALGLMDPLYISEKNKGMWSYTGGGSIFTPDNNNALLSYDYITTDQNRYVIFNDRPQNYDRDEKRKRKTVTSVKDVNTVCYKLNNGEFERSYLFGEPEDDSKSTHCFIEGSNYMKGDNTYATLVIQRDGKERQARVAWITFE